MLRRHIKAFHSASGEECGRCGAWFATLEDLNHHTARPMQCEPVHSENRNPEDGIGQVDLQRLFDKKVRTWNDMWFIVFRDSDGDIPCPGEAALDISIWIMQTELRLALGMNAEIRNVKNGGFTGTSSTPTRQTHIQTQTQTQHPHPT